VERLGRSKYKIGKKSMHINGAKMKIINVIGPPASISSSFLSSFARVVLAIVVPSG